MWQLYSGYEQDIVRLECHWFPLFQLEWRHAANIAYVQNDVSTDNLLPKFGRHILLLRQMVNDLSPLLDLCLLHFSSR